jgi:sensor histidine kinase YesM
MKRNSLRLARLLPTDPDYAPFGLRWLRGFNALVFAIYMPIALSRGWYEFKDQVSFRGGKPFRVAFAEQIVNVPSWTLLTVVVYTTLMLTAIVSLNSTEGRSSRWRIAVLVAALLIFSTLFQPIVWNLRFVSGISYRPFSWTYPGIVTNVVGPVLVTLLAVAPIYLRRRRQSAVRDLRDAKLRRINAERQETEARLQSLQAQIEPHFLFNTLAHILRLHQVDAQRGRAMLQSLTEYMRSALPQMRGQKEFTLGHELALTRAYVNVQQIRMGERLRVEIDVPAALMEARVPPMTVLTLAENAVKHGLGPKGEGGTLRIEASLQGEVLVVAVCDDGVGLRLGAGTGHGLSNTRSRLAAAYGSRAALEIGNRLAGGVRAALLLPFAPVAAEARAQ